MRNALILTGVWLGILVTAYAIVFWDQGIDRPLPISLLEQETDVAASDIVHPDGLFSLTVPMGWHVVDNVSWVEMRDPNDSIVVWLLAIDSDDLEVAIAEVLEAAAFDDELVLVSQDVIADSWTGQDVHLAYESATGDAVVSLWIQRPEEWTVAMVAQGAPGAMDVLSENLDWIWSELAIPAEELLLL